MSVETGKVKLVPVTEDNITLLEYLHSANFNEVYPDYCYDEIANGFLAQGTLAYVGSELAGEICIQWDIYKGKLLLYIVSLSVCEEFRGCKIGTLLLQTEIDNAKEAQAVFLHVRESNFIAQGLYTKLGFTKVAVAPKYYGHEEDGFLMRRVNPAPIYGKYNEIFEILGYRYFMYTPFSLSRTPDVYVDDLPVIKKQADLTPLDKFVEKKEESDNENEEKTRRRRFPLPEEVEEEDKISKDLLHDIVSLPQPNEELKKIEEEDEEDIHEVLKDEDLIP